MHDTTDVAKTSSLCMTDQHEWIGAASSLALSVVFCAGNHQEAN
jgi:hypothetical protein